MALVTVPEILADSADFSLARDSDVLPLMNGGEVITIHPRAVWLFSFKPYVLEGSEIKAWMAALARLTRIDNYFKAGFPGYTGAVYTGAVPLVNGGGQTGFSINVDGAAASTMILRDGEFFELNNEFKIVVGNVTTNGAGQATISFEPPLKAPPADNAALNLATPKCRFRLIEPRMVMNITPPVLGRTTINCVEPGYAA